MVNDDTYDKKLSKFFTDAGRTEENANFESEDDIKYITIEKQNENQKKNVLQCALIIPEKEPTKVDYKLAGVKTAGNSNQLY